MPRLKTYHRPNTVDEALQLLARHGAIHASTQLLAGGTYSVPLLDKMEIDEVIDLQGLQERELSEISLDGDRLTIGAMTRLQALVDDIRVPDLLRQMAVLEGPNTMRNVATVGGLIAGADSESELFAAFLVYDAVVSLQSFDGLKSIPLTDFLNDRLASLNNGILKTVSLPTSGRTASARVARTPVDRPIVAAISRRAEDNATQQSIRERTRVAVCGIAETPCLVDPEKVGDAVRHQGDFRGSRAYRQQMAAVLVERVLIE